MNDLRYTTSTLLRPMLHSKQSVRKLSSVCPPPCISGTIWSTCSGDCFPSFPHNTHLKLSLLSTLYRTPGVVFVFPFLWGSWYSFQYLRIAVSCLSFESFNASRNGLISPFALSILCIDLTETGMLRISLISSDDLPSR